MKNSQAFYILFFICNLLPIYGGSPQLEQFLKLVKEAHDQLQSIDHSHVPLDEIHRSKRSASIEELLASFEFADDDSELRDSDLEGGDAWYQSFRALECRHGGCPKTTLRWKTKKSQPEDYYEYYEENPKQEKSPDLKDQWEETQNDLSHEANYKLSKVEQDAVEKSLPNTAWPIRHPAKRNVDPMQAIKLKTSLRLMSHGGEAILPSTVLGSDTEKISVEDILSDTKHDESPDPWKESYEVMESRKLLSVDDSDEDQMTEEKICGSKNCLNHALDLQQFDNMKVKTRLDRVLEGLSFDNTDIDTMKTDKKDEKKGAIVALSDELINSEAFLKLQNFLKGKGVPKSKKKNKTKCDKKTTTDRPKAPVPLNLAEGKDKNVNIKLHMSVNATVLGDSKLPEQFHKNNTITFKPPTETKKNAKKPKKSFLGLDDFDFDADRDRRAVVFPIGYGPKRKTNEEISKSVIEATETFPLDEIITGKLTSQLVKTIFALVKSSPSLKVLWPGLMRNKVATAQQVQNFYAIRNHENESEMHRTELMLRQAMETINAIIEQQVRSRSCVPLRADLKAFYNLILTTKAENDRFQDRQKRETESEDSSAISDSQLRKKSRIVKKILKNYEELPREDQDQVVSIKDSLLVIAEQLRSLEQSSKRKKRQLIESHLLDNDTTLFESQNLESKLTPQYLKLARTAEMLLHNSIKDPEMPMNYNFI